MSRDAASERQVQAADPAASTWLWANAGSGKTRVLTDRVARLLLHDVEPQRILCLTYTKSAASEMQNRLFQTLGAWAMKPDVALVADLTALGETARLDPAHLSRARRLFARAIETPGGLRIQTIHSFCATLLRRFPLEAAVSPQFSELDDRAARLLREEIVEEMAAGLAPQVMTEIALAYTGEDFTKLMEQVAARRGSFVAGPDAARLFELPEGESVARILGDVFLGGEAKWMAEVLAVLAQGSANDAKAFRALSGLNLAEPGLEALAGLEVVLLTGSGAKVSFAAKLGSFPTKASQGRLSSIMPHLDDLMRRVEAARERRLVLQATRKTAALHRFAGAFLPIYAARKAARGWLDFDDLISRAKALLSDRSVAAWVLFRLDGGIDHVLVDEAQDTSPDQWRVIELLTQEFSAGEGTRKGGRTLFVVGDKKQSIYSFQGADVAAFDDKHQAFRGQFEAANQAFQSLKLEYSFRSAPAILTLVDAAFGDRFPQALGPDVAHLAFRNSLPGRVDLWPLIVPEQDVPDENFEDPVDLIRNAHHAARLAEKIASRIDSMLAEGVQIVTSAGVRPVHPGDFLILVQRRSTLFSEIIRTCKQRSLPIAGADRLKLGAELAVKDLAALLSFLATPEDDLSLAALLRSPLCGWTERELYALAQGRPGYLWEALRGQADHYPETFAYLTDLRDQTDYLRPYDLIERALTRHDGRRRLITRLGAEAADGIDELLNQALAYERGEVPSLTGFLVWLETDEIEVKRQADSAGQRIRVMTVHGAKGLESEIVILPDTADRAPQDRDEIYLADDGSPLWKTEKDDSPPLVVALRQQKAEREAEENLRLLYVALTRARTWLIVAGAGTAAKPNCWYNLVSDGMAAVGAAPLGDMLRHETGAWPGLAGGAAALAVAELLPERWMLETAAAPLRPSEPLSPSALGGAKVLPGEVDDSDEDTAKARGSALHLLLEHLAARDPATWPELAAHLVPESLRDSLLAEAGAVLTAPELVSLFGTNSLAEVPVTADFAGRRLYGVLDRLVIEADRILAVDYKSNHRIPRSAKEVPEGLLRQMGAYAGMLAQIYPDRKIEVAILWTRRAQLMPLDADIVRAALQRAARDSGSPLDVALLEP